MAALISPDAPAPDFSLSALDGESYRLADQPGRIIILNFWSAECPWSERSDRHILASLPAWGPQVVYWPVAANQSEALEQLRQAAEQRGLPRLLLDAHQLVADAYEAQTTPHLFVIDARAGAPGVLAYQGALDDVTFRRREPTRSYLQEAVDALLAGCRPNPAVTDPYGCTIVRFEV